MTSTSISESPDKMFGPLTINQPNNSEIYQETKCLLCEDSFNLTLAFKIFVKHLFEAHKVVIEDVQNIENLTEYITYWRDKFKKTPIEEVVPSVKADSTYYLLSNLLEEDRQLRHKIRLDYTLEIQEFERLDNGYVRDCLFCKFEFKGNRRDFLEHLTSAHNLHLGNPQNLVFIDDLIEKIDGKLKRFECIYCGKTFPNRTILKEHMRKKLHKWINPEKAEFDRFYIQNYLESEQTRNEPDSILTNTNSDDEYNDWREKQDEINCLFCGKYENDINLLCLHMEADHNFDFIENTKDFNFYQKIKFVNFIRKRNFEKKCFFCNETFDSFNCLQRHLNEENHFRVPDMKIFDQPEFYFSTYENDAFLYFIDDLED